MNEEGREGGRGERKLFLKGKYQLTKEREREKVRKRKKEEERERSERRETVP